MHRFIPNVQSATGVNTNEDKESMVDFIIGYLLRGLKESSDEFTMNEYTETRYDARLNSNSALALADAEAYLPFCREACNEVMHQMAHKLPAGSTCSLSPSTKIDKNQVFGQVCMKFRFGPETPAPRSKVGSLSNKF